MKEREGTWSELEIGMTVLTKTELPVVCVGLQNGWTLFEDRNRHQIKVPPQSPDKVLVILEMTPEEAETQASLTLGAHRWLDFETEARVEKRAPRWVVDRFPRKGERDALNRARDHLQWHHGTYAGDAINGGFKTLVQITQAHEEMHDPAAVGGLFMDKPHTHKE